ncbi:mechanosensitive ion channel family protein [Paraliomyxa miuraensis]|uniref:mechanosensitive ion channel family protein n=1 Tax=Paraliomyxa miuraensis TaxID=376150 RepID=UPI00225966C0|nr:mechanosensitive ion channel family protein [Paraliomyxa miuraensis]MCX4244261.1 mechanosensitive ion channel family protein [Paraliomyxa miuraensis]
MDIAKDFLDYAKQNAGEMAWRLLIAFVILLLAWILSRVARMALRRVFTHMRTSSEAKTVQPVLETVATIALMAVGIVLSLEQLGFDLTAVIAGAGVVGLAVAFGSQELVRDVISGFFIIMENALETGDTVDLGSYSGTVESVGLRMTTIRAFDGKLWYVPNGQIKTVGNTSRTWMRAIVTVGLAYEQDVKRGMEIMAEVGKAWHADNGELALEEPSVQGILSFDASSVGVRMVVKVGAGQQGGVERELRQRIKEAFDREGIDIPFDRRVVLLRKQDAEAAAE